MRRLIANKDVQFVQTIQDYGIEAAPLPQAAEIIYNILKYDEILEAVNELNSSDGIDWEQHSINDGFSWYFYPSVLPFSIEGLEIDDMYAGILCDGPIEFPENIETADDLAKWLMNGIPEELVEDAYVDEVMCNFLNEDGTAYSYSPDEVHINSNNVRVIFSASFDGISNLYSDNANIASLEADNANITILHAKQVRGAILEACKMHHLPGALTITYQSNGSANITNGTANILDKGQLYMLELQLKGGVGFTNYHIIQQRFGITTSEDRPIYELIPIQVCNDSDTIVYNAHLQVTGCMRSENDKKMHLQAKIISENGTVFKFNEHGRELKAYLYN